MQPSSARRMRTHASARSTPRRHRRCPASRSSRPPTPTSGSFQPPPIPGLDQRMGRPFLADGRRPLRGRHRRRRRSARRAPRASTRPSSSRSTTTRFPSWSIPTRRSRATCCSTPRRHERLHEPPGRSVTRRCSTAATSSSPAALVSQRLAACPLESRACAAVVGDDGRLTLWLSTQTPHQDRDALAMILGMEPGRGARRRTRRRRGLRGQGPRHRGDPRVLAGAQDRQPRALDRDAQREHGRAWPTAGRHTSSSRSAAAGRARRTPTACGVVQDAGAYPRIGAFLPGFTALMASGVYAIPKIEAETVASSPTRRRSARSAAPGDPRPRRRSSGRWTSSRPSSACDPAEVRRRNLFASDAFPVTTASGAHYDSGDYERALDLALETAGYDALREEQQRRRERGDSLALGIGVSVYVEITNGLVEPEFGAVEITPDGEASLRTGSFSHGQGHETTFAMIVADRLGLPVESVRGHQGRHRRGVAGRGHVRLQVDSDRRRRRPGWPRTWSSSAPGSSPPSSSRRAPTTSCSTPPRGGFHVVGSPHARALVDGPRRARREHEGRLEELRAERGLQGRRADVPVRGPHRRRRGRHRRPARSSCSASSPSTTPAPIINPLIAEGQVHGGLATGVAQALYEEFLYDEDGNPLTRPSSATRSPRQPSCPRSRSSRWRRRRRSMRSARRASASRARSGRLPPCTTPWSTRSRPFGVRHVEMPANGERVWRALQDAQRPTDRPEAPIGPIPRPYSSQMVGWCLDK